MFCKKNILRSSVQILILFIVGCSFFSAKGPQSVKTEQSTPGSVITKSIIGTVVTIDRRPVPDDYGCIVLLYLKPDNIVVDSITVRNGTFSIEKDLQNGGYEIIAKCSNNYSGTMDFTYKNGVVSEEIRIVVDYINPEDSDFKRQEKKSRPTYDDVGGEIR